MQVSQIPPRRTTIVTRADLPPWEVERHGELASTMERARELALAGVASGVVVVADVQHRGRGTHGREWVAPAGTCLMFTIILRRTFEPDALARLPGQVAAIIRNVVNDRYGLVVDVKLPNDVMVGERKLCGVLCLSQMSGGRSPWALCGIGINTHLRQEEAQIENSTSLLMEGVDVPSHERLLAELLAGLDELRTA
jgi:BirA family biotin operon repressor/biotin-[acetyl-CoA-carboxylase] ligase